MSIRTFSSTQEWINQSGDGALAGDIQVARRWRPWGLCVSQGVRISMRGVDLDDVEDQRTVASPHAPAESQPPDTNTVVLQRMPAPSADGMTLEPTRIMEVPSIDDDDVPLGQFAEDSRCGPVPGYSILGRLGRGGMGIVYLAVQEKLQRVVALKVLRPCRAERRDFMERFEREARVLARLNHANIVTAYDYGEVGGNAYLALEYVEGMDCAEAVERHGAIAPCCALVIVRDAVLGLSHALSAGVVHRDVKPANLLLVHEVCKDAGVGGVTGHVKITDLGLARIIADEDSDRAETQPGIVIGTPCYMAPEQALGQAVDFRSDIYALGISLYHMVTGQKPFSRSSIAGVIRSKLEDDLPDPRCLIEGIGSDFVRVLDRMIAREPQHRYSSYGELLVDLEALIAGARPETPPLSPGCSSLGRAPSSFRRRQAPQRQGTHILPHRIVRGRRRGLPHWREMVRYATIFCAGIALGWVLFA